MDMAEEDGITWQEARSKIINSNAYTALYDLETGLCGNNRISSIISNFSNDNFTFKKFFR